VAESFSDGLQVCAALEEPGGVRVTQVVDAGAVGNARGGEVRFPNAPTEPVTGKVPLTGAVVSGRDGWSVFAVGASVGAVVGVGVATGAAAASARVVGGECSVAIASAVEIWRGRLVAG
jgi:hypothetical protein